MAAIDLDTLKASHHATWAAGDYAAIAELIDEIPPRHLLDRVGIEAGHTVLDVATGTGNVAVRAAAAGGGGGGRAPGAAVVGLDLAPELFEAARPRADELGVSVEWVEGDAEELPYPDATFDCVVSAFGVQFTPRHALAAAELVRVCRPGGVIGVCNWTPEGKVGELFSIMSRYLPPAPAYASPPPLWGDEAHVRGLWADADVKLEFERATTPFHFDSAEHYVSFFETNYGPMVKARERLTERGRWDACRAEIVEMIEGRNVATDGSLDVPGEYLLVVARRTG
jgi:ubiquinone/menaquinone biosynthesis C-methylase UbiE